MPVLNCGSNRFPVALRPSESGNCVCISNDGSLIFEISEVGGCLTGGDVFNLFSFAIFLSMFVCVFL